MQIFVRPGLRLGKCPSREKIKEETVAPPMTSYVKVYTVKADILGFGSSSAYVHVCHVGVGTAQVANIPHAPIFRNFLPPCGQRLVYVCGDKHSYPQQNPSVNVLERT